MSSETVINKIFLEASTPFWDHGYGGKIFYVNWLFAIEFDRFFDISSFYELITRLNVNVLMEKRHYNSSKMVQYLEKYSYFVKLKTKLRLESQKSFNSYFA